MGPQAACEAVSSECSQVCSAEPRPWAHKLGIRSTSGGPAKACEVSEVVDAERSGKTCVRVAASVRGPSGGRPSCFRSRVLPRLHGGMKGKWVLE